MGVAVQATPRGRIADIEILRDIAVIFVLIQHAPVVLFPWRTNADGHLYTYFGFWTGVDLFFAISGFVIARSLLPILHATRDTAAFFNATLAFWVRRVWRLLPSAWLWLAVILFLVVFFNRSGAFGTFRGNFEATVAAVLDVANFRALLGLMKAEHGVSFPYWSLSIEEQFYFLLPIIVFVSRRWLPYVLAAGVLAQLFTIRFGPGTTDFGGLLNVTRSDALLLGVLIALWSRHPTYRLFEPAALKTYPAIGVAVLALLTLCLAAVGSLYLHIVAFPVGLTALISTLLVPIASFDGDYLLPVGALKHAMLWVGSRSYPLYLIHMPAYLLAREIWYRLEPAGTVFGASYTLRFGLTALMILVTLADLNYRFVEVPLRRHGARIATRLAERTA
jgi:peptidoglycan/LPS O-acetylase OafA/YrhL